MSANVLAVDIGGTSTKMALVCRSGTVSHWLSFATVPPVADFLQQLAAQARALVRTAKTDLAGVACGVAGFVDGDGAMLYNGNLPWLEGAAITNCLRQVTNKPVVVESDSNAACVGEYLFGAGAGASRLLCITVGTGVGVGMMVGGTLVRTAFGCLGDAGHVVVEPDGPACTCGGRGCAEAVISTVALGRRFAVAGNFRALVSAVQAGDASALELAQEAGDALGTAVASLANIFMPECIAVAGGLAHLGAPLISAADASFRRHAGTFVTRRAQVIAAQTGSHATLLGAAACFFAQEQGNAKERP